MQRLIERADHDKQLARHAGSGRLVWRDLAYDHVRFRAQLQV
jgi:hypothetical protein